MKRVLSVGILLGLTSVLVVGNPTKAEEAPKVAEIIDTVEIEPNAAILAKDLVRSTRHWEEDTNDTTIKISYPDAQLLMMLMSAEGLNQGIGGMVKIGNVVLNRVKSPDFPNTIQDVIYQSGQFECVTNGSIYNAQITPEVRQALCEIEKNKSNDTEIIAFETTVNGRVLQKYFHYLYTDGEHDFYIQKKN